MLYQNDDNRFLKLQEQLAEAYLKATSTFPIKAEESSASIKRKDIKQILNDRELKLIYRKQVNQKLIVKPLFI